MWPWAETGDALTGRADGEGNSRSHPIGRPMSHSAALLAPKRLGVRSPLPNLGSLTVDFH